MEKFSWQMYNVNKAINSYQKERVVLMQLYKPGRPKEVRPLDEGLSEIPAKKGEYRIIGTSSKKPVYVGVTNNLRRRAKEHLETGKLSEQNPIFAFKVADGRASQSRINDHEREKIKQHKPELNKRGGGAGRPYKR